MDVWDLKIWISVLFEISCFFQAKAAVAAPAWANPKLNPCASRPGGWQLLFWPPDGKCYRIFQVGYPCPEGMELSPEVAKSGKNLSAECRCPPQTAQSATDGKCYSLYTSGPCKKGNYFGPDTNYKSTSGSKRQWGVCKQLKPCTADPLTIYWPRDDHCYKKLTRGPCSKGQLLVVDHSGLPLCECEKSNELVDYKFEDGQCYQHFTQGPCLEKGHLFLPDKTCGCHSFLPHYHAVSEQCFELDVRGPCDRGQIFSLNSETRRASCFCKPNYIAYLNSTTCYKPYTQGPCKQDEILINSTSCVRQPCERGYLYFHSENKCYRIGSRGPCSKRSLVTFDFDTRPSVDGLSYNGVCSGEKTTVPDRCDRTKGLARFKNSCYKIYTRGPCPRGAWLVPKREGREELFGAGNKNAGEHYGVCDCIPGYARTLGSKEGKNVTICLAPTVMLAQYLNKNLTGIMKFS